MKFRFLLAPAVALGAAATASADQLQTLEQAIAQIYPNEELTVADFELGSRDYARLKFEYEVPSIRPQVKAWRTSAGAWLFLDQVYGLNDVVTYLLGVDPEGRITGLEILTCEEGYCDSLYTDEWPDGPGYTRALDAGGRSADRVRRDAVDHPRGGGRQKAPGHPRPLSPRR